MARQGNFSGRESGFTLIEILVALTLAAGVFALLAPAIAVFSNNWKDGLARVDKLDMIARASDIFIRDTNGLRRVVATNGESSHFIFSGSATSLSFVTAEPRFPTNDGTYFVSYEAAALNPDRALLRSRSKYRQNMVAFPGATPANRTVLVQGQFDFAFAYGRRLKGSVVWSADWSTADRLPDLIRLHILDSAKGAPAAPPIVARVRADAELGCLLKRPLGCTVKSGGALQAPADANGTHREGPEQ